MARSTDHRSGVNHPAVSSRVRVDLAAECIWRDGERYEVTPKAFRVLRCLMECPEQLLTKSQIFAAVWPGTAVFDNVLNVAISELRHALGDDPKQPRFIATVYRRGFRWVGPSAANLASTPEQGENIFVGREQTLAELDRYCALADAGQRQLVFLTGEPGVGKSKLIDRFLQGHTARQGWVAYGQCVDRYGVGELYRPFLDAAEGLLRAGGEPLQAIFRKHAPSWLLRMHDVLDEENLAVLRKVVSDASSERMQRELERALEAAASARLVIVVLEDLHWSDVATVGLLAALAAGRANARLLIVASYRPFDAIAHQHPVIALKRELTPKRLCSEIPQGPCVGVGIGVSVGSGMAGSVGVSVGSSVGV